MIRVVFKSIVLVAVLLVSVSAWAQGALKGVVSDQLGGVIKGATVILEKGDAKANETATDGSGVYNFTSVASGRYHVQIEAPGFVAYRSTDMFVGAGSSTANAMLTITPLTQDIVVSATGSEVPVAQVGASVTLVDKLQIDAENKLDVLENLRQISGVQVVQTGQRGGNTSLFIRGGESSFNKILIDGVPANAIGGGFDFAQLSNGGVESIEVLRGANSVLYGADALAGVVNVTTQRGESETPELKLWADGGNFRTHNKAASIAGAYHRFDYYSLFSRFDTQGSYPNDYFHNATYAGNFGVKILPKTDFRITYRRNWTGLGLPNGIAHYGIADDSTQKNQNTYLGSSLQNQTTSRWRNTLRFAYSQFASLYMNPSPTGQTSSFGDYLGNPMTIVGANGTSVTGRAILDFGCCTPYPQSFPSYAARRSGYLQSEYTVTSSWSVLGGMRYEYENGSGVRRNNRSYFAEGHGSIGRRLYVTGGVGFEDNEVFGFVASPRISAAYYLRQPTSAGFVTDTKVRFNFGKGIKETNTYNETHQLFALLTTAQRTQFNVDPLAPERSRSLDAGIEQGLWHGKLRVDATYFHNRFYDLITFLNNTALVSIGVDPAAATASGFGAYVNATSTKSQGLELQAQADLGNGFRVQGNYTYLDAVVTKAFGSPSTNPAFPGVKIGAFSPLEGERPFRRAPHSASVGMTYTKRKFTGSITGYMVSRRDDSTFLTDAFYGNSLLLPNHDLAAAYQKFDLSGQYRLSPRISIYTSIENLFSQHYQATLGFPATPFAMRSGVSLTLGGSKH